MSTDETYNGWPNYETWCVHLWLSNDQGTDNAVREIAAAAESDLAAGEAIRDWIRDGMPEDMDSGMAADLLSHAFTRVDWRKIGESFRED